MANYLNWRAFLALVGILGTLEVFGPSEAAAATWCVSAGGDASDSNPGTAQQPVRSVAKAMSLARPGDVVVFAPGTYPCSGGGGA